MKLRIKILFRGEYYLLKPEYEYLVKDILVPSKFHFGVHFTKMINGGGGTNAVLALARGYNWER